MDPLLQNNSTHSPGSQTTLRIVSRKKALGCHASVYIRRSQMTLGLLFWLEKAFVFFEFAGVDLYQHRGHWGFRSIYIYI